jgi:hypothetical protein
MFWKTAAQERGLTPFAKSFGDRSESAGKPLAHARGSVLQKILAGARIYFQLMTN